jgi:hypothetical protein
MLRGESLCNLGMVHLLTSLEVIELRLFGLDVFVPLSDFLLLVKAAFSVIVLIVQMLSWLLIFVFHGLFPFELS